jgi:hypothetical protein
MNIIEQFRNEQVAVENKDCTRQELNDVLSYLLCRKTKVDGVCYYYLNNKDMKSTFSTNYTRKPSYPLATFLRAIEHDKKAISEGNNENELRALNRIINDMKNTQPQPMEDTPFEMSITQHGITHSVSIPTSDVTIYEVKELFVAALKGAGFSLQTINLILTDEA